MNKKIITVIISSVVILVTSCSPPAEFRNTDFGFSTKDVDGKYVVEYRGDLYSGKVIEESLDGAMNMGSYSEGIYLNGFRNGGFIGGRYDYSGKKCKTEEVNYLNGVKHGVQIKYDLSGNILSKGELRNGIKEGLWFSEFRKDDKGIVSKGEYKNGIQEGLWFSEDDNKVILSKGEYKNGIKEGFWFEKGKRGEYKNGQREGVWFQLKEDGEVLCKYGSYNNGIKNGVFRAYKFQNNQYVFSSYEEYKQGKIHGLNLLLNWGSNRNEQELFVYSLKYSYEYNDIVESNAYVKDKWSIWVDFVAEEGFNITHKVMRDNKLYLVTYTTKDFEDSDRAYSRVLGEKIEKRLCRKCTNLKVQVIDYFSDWVNERLDKRLRILHSDIESTLKSIGMTTAGQKITTSCSNNSTITMDTSLEEDAEAYLDYLGNRSELNNSESVSNEVDFRKCDSELTATWQGLDTMIKIKYQTDFARQKFDSVAQKIREERNSQE